MRFDVLHNFISPVTGRILADYKYVLVGNKNGIAIPSPILIDLRLDFINLRKRYNTLIEADLVVGHPNDELENAQVLSEMDDGFLFNTAGVVTTLPTSPKLPLCYAASTANISATYNNGTGGIGATLTGSIGTFTIDGQTPPVNSAILIKDQSSTFQNGIYTLTNTGGLLTAWILTRHTSYDQPQEIQAGDIVAVKLGTVNSSSLWVQTEEVNTIGTDAILFISINLFNTLPENNIWIGNSSNRPVPNQRVGLINLPSFVTVDPTSNFGLYNLYTGQVLAVTGPTQVAQPTTTMRIDMSNTPNLSVGKIWMGVKNFTPPVITIDAIPPFVHITGSLNWDPQGALSDSHAVATEVGLGPKYIFIGSTDPAKLNQINSTVALYIDNMADLTLKRIWRGDTSNRPVEVDDLTTLELTVKNIEDVIIPEIEAEIAGLESEIVAIQAEILGMQEEITALGAAVLIIQGQILVLQGQIVGLIAAIAGLRLNTISADGDVSFYGFKLINLADPVNPTDGVNLRTLQNAIPVIPSLNQMNNAGDIDIKNFKIINSANPVNGQDLVNLSTLTAYIGGLHIDGFVEGRSSPGGIILTSLGPKGLLCNIPAGGDVNMGNYKITHLADPINPQDAVNLRTLLTYPGTVTSVSGTAGQITVINGTTTPVISIDPTYVGQTSITTLGTISTGTWHGSLIPLANGGTNANLTPSNGGIFYSTASAGAILSGTSIANQILLSGASGSPPSAAPPSWSTAVYPATTTINQLLYSSSANFITGLATANNSVLLTNGSGVPAWQTTSSNLVTSLTGTANQIAVSGSTGAITISMPSAVVITTSVTAGNLELITNTLQSNNTNGSISIAPNGSGNILMLPGGSTGLVGINGTPSFLLDVFGTTRVKKLLGSSAIASVVAGPACGTGGSILIFGSELNGKIEVITGTGATSGLIGTFTITAMPSNLFSVVLTAANTTTAPIVIWAATTSTTTYTLNTNTALASGSTVYLWNFMVMG